MSLDSKEHLFLPQVPDELTQLLRVAQLPPNKKWNVRVSSSKSVTNRAIVLAAMSSEAVELQGPLLADDTWWGLKALDTLGCELDLSRLPDQIVISPPRARPQRTCIELHTGQAGTLARFLPAALLNWNRIHPDAAVNLFRITADAQLMQRPLSPLLDALQEWGAQIQKNSWPVHLIPSLLAGVCRIDGSQSGQFLSGLLMAAAGSGRECMIERVNQLVQPDYVRITASMLAEFGVDVIHDPELFRFFVDGSQFKPPTRYSIEADASTACYFAALACVLQCEIEILNLGSSTLQPDFMFLDFLQRFSCRVDSSPHECRIVGLRANSVVLNDSPLSFDMTACSDQAITAGVLALCTGRAVLVTGVAHIRHHESDRIASFCTNCQALGVAVTEYPDGFFVPAGTQPDKLAGVWRTHKDHRFALAGIVLASCAPHVSVEHVSCMRKTAPDFLQKLVDLGFKFV